MINKYLLFYHHTQIKQEYIDEKYNHDNEEQKSNIRLWVFLIVGSIILIIAMFFLAMKLNRRMQYMRSHFRSFMKRCIVIVIIFFSIIMGGIWLLNLGTRKKIKDIEKK